MQLCSNFYTHDSNKGNEKGNYVVKLKCFYGINSLLTPWYRIVLNGKSLYICMKNTFRCKMLSLYPLYVYD